MSFAERVKTLKNERNMTSEQLSLRSGIPLSTLNKILAGITGEPKLSIVLAIAGAFECPVGCLLDGEEYLTDRLDIDETRVIKKYRRLDENSRELVEMVIDKELARAEAAATPLYEEVAEEIRMIPLPLYYFPVSAGTGTFLEDA